MKKSVIIGIVIGIIIIALIIGYFYFKSSQQPKQLTGNEVLEVKVTMDNGVPLSKIEVDLWQAGSTGAPNAGISHTDDDGTAIFNIPEGNYDIGFNLNNFPKNLVYPEKTSILVEKNITAHKTILIKAQQEQQKS